MENKEILQSIFQADVNDAIQKFLQNLLSARRIATYDEMMFRKLSVLAMNKVNLLFHNKSIESLSNDVNQLKTELMDIFTTEDSFREFSEIMSVISTDTTRKMLLRDLTSAIINSVAQNLHLYFQRIIDNLKSENTP